jgi:hypothetical protein
MTGSEAIFKDFVVTHLKKQADEFPAAPDPLLPKVTSSPVQFTKVFTGHIDAGGSQELTVNLDRVSIASFALFDSTRSLRVTVRGASGNVIALDRNTHGLIEVSDPATIVNLGYGFENPNPGPWKVRLDTSSATPAGGADFALSAKVIGGATLRAQADRLIPQAGQPVTIKASLELADNPMNDAVLQGSARGPDGKRVELKFEKTGNENRAVWTPNDPGVYAIDVTAKGVTPDGMQVERANFLSVEVEPDPNRGILTIVLAAIGLLTVVTLIGFWLKQRFGRKVKRSGLEL